ncbi:MAG: lytic transglycosylase domain-containing protein [Rhodospirillales bacterium]|nr:lytic transglycosylase domain-containing protein [Alphaproteobacteria bacterium]MCB9987242.1 lytic transglycosylase domain-containing protein [Rhodospirillales bacterium]USO07897.1 MAG: lytic transglycosylase domain-containing protein [Rhodospirillales bacterium]
MKRKLSGKSGLGRYLNRLAIFAGVLLGAAAIGSAAKTGVWTPQISGLTQNDDAAKTARGPSAYRTASGAFNLAVPDFRDPQAYAHLRDRLQQGRAIARATLDADTVPVKQEAAPATTVFGGLAKLSGPVERAAARFGITGPGAPKTIQLAALPDFDQLPSAAQAAADARPTAEPAAKPLISPHATGTTKVRVFKFWSRRRAVHATRYLNKHLASALKRSAAAMKAENWTADSVIGYHKGQPLILKNVLADRDISRVPEDKAHRAAWVRALEEHGFERQRGLNPQTVDISGQTPSRFHNTVRKLIPGILRTESGRFAAAVSNAGAMGPMQIMPKTAQGYGLENPFSFVDSVRTAARIMGENLTAARGNVAEALARYNWGAAGVLRARAQGGNNFLAYAPSETRNYVAKIAGIFKRHAAPVQVENAAHAKFLARKGHSSHTALAYRR